MKKSELRNILKESIKELMKEETYRITGKYNRDVNDNLRDVETDRPQDAWMFTEKYQINPGAVISILNNAAERLSPLANAVGFGKHVAGYKQPSMAALKQKRPGEWDWMAPITDEVVAELEEINSKILNLSEKISNEAGGKMAGAWTLPSYSKLKYPS